MLFRGTSRSGSAEHVENGQVILVDGVDAVSGGQAVRSSRLPRSAVLDASAGGRLARWIDREPAMRMKVLSYLGECALSTNQRLWLRYAGEVSLLAEGVAGWRQVLAPEG